LTEALTPESASNKAAPCEVYPEYGRTPPFSLANAFRFVGERKSAVPKYNPASAANTDRGYLLARSAIMLRLRTAADNLYVTRHAAQVKGRCLKG